MKRNAFTLVELLVVISIIGALAGLLFPVVSSMIERARRAQCISNLMTIRDALENYATDHKDFYPESLIDLYPQYINEPEIFVCPSCRAKGITKVLNQGEKFTQEHISYNYIGKHKRALIKTTDLLVCDRNGTRDANGPLEWGNNHLLNKPKGGHILKRNSSVKWYPLDGMTLQVWTNMFSYGWKSNMWAKP